jgi:hypothetical protein
MNLSILLFSAGKPPFRTSCPCGQANPRGPSRLAGRHGYCLLSVLALTAGVLLYYFLRSNNILIYKWFAILPKNNAIVSFSHPSFAADFLRYNLPDGLWLLSGLLFLRALWHETPQTFLIYRWCFLLIAFLFEIAQIFGVIAGTFDVLDLATMGLIAVLESLAHTILLTRRRT